MITKLVFVVIYLISKQQKYPEQRVSDVLNQASN